MSKLINADDLGVALHAAWVEEHSSYLKDAVWRVRRRVDDLPDATEPLRKRIAELEEQNKKMEIGLRNCRHLAYKVEQLDDDEVQACLIRFCETAGITASLLRGE